MLHVFKIINSQLIVRQTCFIILFGTTPWTPKESYSIMLPKVNDTVLPTFVNESTEVKKILLQIIQNEELKTTDKNQLPQTNVFVLLKRSEPIGEHPDLNELPNFRLAKSCKKYSIIFRDSLDFEIFDENFQELSLTEKSSPAVDNDAEGEKFWYQSKTHVKGFKDILVNNQSIWK